MWSVSNSRRSHLGSSWSPSHSCSPEIGWTVIIWRLSWTGCRLRAQLGLLAPHLHPVSQCSWVFSLQSHWIPRAIIFRGSVSRAQRTKVPRDRGRSCKTSLDLMLEVTQWHWCWTLLVNEITKTNPESMDPIVLWKGYHLNLEIDTLYSEVIGFNWNPSW